MKRKWLVQIISLGLVFSLVGCSTNTLQSNGVNQTTNTEDDSTVKTEAVEIEVTEKTETTTDVEQEVSVEIVTDVESTVDPAVEAEVIVENGTGVETTVIVEEEEELDEAQKNSIAMLNYLAFLAQQVNLSKNSRMFLEEAYASLIINTNPEKVNELTESHLSSLLDIIEKYRMINVKRERLQYLYNQNKAQAIREAMPNPIALLSATNARNLKQLAASAIYMAVDSVNSYQAYNDELESEFLQEGWTLDDDEADNLHDNRKRAFMYMLQIIREENLPQELTLNEKAVEDFVKCMNKTNNMQKIQFLESEKDTYAYFGDYWLLLSECYYMNEDYDKCLEAISEYEKLETKIFRKDYYFAQAIPNVIVSASIEYPLDEYIEVAEKYLKILEENTENNEWSLRTFAAQVYMDLYAQTGEKGYLEEAKRILVNNVNYLTAEQDVLNKQFMSPVKEVKDEDATTREEKKKIKDYNKELNDRRKVELAPVYEPLRINCEMLFAVADELKISKSEKTVIEGIINKPGEEVFMSADLQNIFTFSPETISIDAEFDKNTIVLPANYVSNDSVIKVTVTEGGRVTPYTDWTVKEVKREGKELSSFEVTYTSKKIKDQKWSKDSKVLIEIYDRKETNYKPITLNFNAKEKKPLGVIKSIVFEQVK